MSVDLVTRIRERLQDDVESAWADLCACDPGLFRRLEREPSWRAPADGLPSLAEAVRLDLAQCLRSARTPVCPAPALRALPARLAGVSLSDLLRVLRSTTTVTVTRMWRGAVPGELAPLIKWSERFLHEREGQFAAFAEHFLEGVSLSHGVGRAQHQAFGALLDGALPAETARRMGMGPGARGYLMAVLPWSAECAAPVSDRVWKLAGRETTCLVTALGARHDDGALGRLTRDAARLASRRAGPGVLGRVPAPSAMPVWESALRSHLKAAGMLAPDCLLVRHEHTALALELLGAPEVRETARRCQELLGARLTGTLKTFYFCGSDRDLTARCLNLHRRTVHRHLERVRVLTGLDPCAPTGMIVLSAMPGIICPAAPAKTPSP